MRKLPNIYRENDRSDLLRSSKLLNETEVKTGPKILLLSTNKNEFHGIKFLAGENKRLLREGNAKSVRKTLEDTQSRKASELYLQWLEMNHLKIDPANYKIAMNMQAHDLAMNYSNADQRAKMKHVLHARRYTSNQTLQPPSIGGGMAHCSDFLLPEINSM